MGAALVPLNSGVLASARRSYWNGLGVLSAVQQLRKNLLIIGVQMMIEVRNPLLAVLRALQVTQTKADEWLDL